MINNAGLFGLNTKNLNQDYFCDNLLAGFIVCLFAGLSVAVRSFVGFSERGLTARALGLGPRDSEFESRRSDKNCLALAQIDTNMVCVFFVSANF